MSMQQGNQEIANARKYMITPTVNASTMPVPRDTTNNSSVLSNIGMGDMVHGNIPARVMWSNVKSSMQSGGVNRFGGDIPLPEYQPIRHDGPGHSHVVGDVLFVDI